MPRAMSRERERRLAAAEHPEREEVAVVEPAADGNDLVGEPVGRHAICRCRAPRGTRDQEIAAAPHSRRPTRRSDRDARANQPPACATSPRSSRPIASQNSALRGAVVVAETSELEMGLVPRSSALVIATDQTRSDSETLQVLRVQRGRFREQPVRVAPFATSERFACCRDGGGHATQFRASRRSLNRGASDQRPTEWTRRALGGLL